MRWFTPFAIVLSVIALGFSLWTWHQADARAEAAALRREKAIVDKYRSSRVALHFHPGAEAELDPNRRAAPVR